MRMLHGKNLTQLKLFVPEIDKSGKKFQKCFANIYSSRLHIILYPYPILIFVAGVGASGTGSYHWAG